MVRTALLSPTAMLIRAPVPAPHGGTPQTFPGGKREHLTTTLEQPHQDFAPSRGPWKNAKLGSRKEGGSKDLSIQVCGKLNTTSLMEHTPTWTL